MEEWELEFGWLKTRHWLKDKFNKEEIPDLKTVLFIIGIQEVGQWPEEITKETKQDLIHVATCTLLAQEGYYQFAGLDTEGWPHFELQRNLAHSSVEAQEHYLKTKVVEYFHAQIFDYEEE